MNNRNPLTPGIGGIGDHRFNAIPQDAATVWLMNSTEDFDECTLTSTIFAGQRMDSAGVKAKIDVAQDLHRSKAFRNRAKLNSRKHRTASDIAAL